MRKTLIICEAGVNHNGDLKIAKELIKAAALAGADIVKFQTFKAGLGISTHAPKAEYQIKNTNITGGQLDMVSKLELSEDDHYELIKVANECGIEIFSTGFDIPSIEFLIKLNFSLFKIPSGEVTNLPLLELIGKQRKKIILSTGMCNLADIENAIEILEANGTSRKLITVLHCTTEYPAPFNEVNIMAMKSMKQCFGTEVGYSDHTHGIEIPIAAVALGATVIEKHFTLDRSMDGPDHNASIEPDEFSHMVKCIRNVESALGDGIKRITDIEKKNIIAARKSVVASCKISKGDHFSSNNLTVKRLWKWYKSNEN